MAASADRYIYAIRALHEKYACVRSVDLAHCLGVSKATVSAAVRQLREAGQLCVERDGHLFLTPSGEERAARLCERVSFFRDLLCGAGVAEKQALEDAVSFSWEMSEESFNAFRAMGKAALPALEE